MPDLPELYEVLDIELAYLVGRHLVEFSDEETELMTSVISALCAAIEVKQSQEFHEYLNKSTTPEAEALWDRIDKLTWKIPSVEEKETTTETQEEA